MKKTAYLAIFLAVVCGVCGVALAGVNAITAPIIEAMNSVTLADGSYSGSANGFGGPVNVSFTVSGGVIAELEISGDSETPSIGGAAIPELQAAILEAGTIEGVDTIGGATLTSNGVFNAIRSALDGGAGSAPVENEPVESEAAQQDESETESTVETIDMTSVGDGSNSGSAAGFGGDVTVSFDVTGGVVSNFAVVGDGETPEIGGAAAESIAEAINTQQDLNFDAVSGATVTSGAIRDAIDAALQGGNGVETPVSDETDGQPIALSDGSYSGSANGFGGEVSVSFDVTDGTVSNMVISAESETPELGGAAAESIADAINASGSLEFDAVSGSTVTSTAIESAINAALGQGE